MSEENGQATVALAAHPYARCLRAHHASSASRLIQRSRRVGFSGPGGSAQDCLPPQPTTSSPIPEQGGGGAGVHGLSPLAVEVRRSGRSGAGAAPGWGLGSGVVVFVPQLVSKAAGRADRLDGEAVFEAA